MEFSFKLSINSNKETVWEYYKDVNKWFCWEPDLEDIKLNGEFKNNTTGIMKLKEMPPLEFELTSVKEYKEFIDESITPFGTIIFKHYIHEKGEKLDIIHAVEIKTEDRQKLNILKNIFADVPESMYLLKDNVEQNGK